MDHPTTEVFIDTSYGYRTWRVGIVIVAFGGLGSLAMLSVVRGLMRGNVALTDLLTKGLLLAGIGGFMLSVAVLFLWRVLINRRFVARIDGSGITMGTQHWPWNQIRWIDGRREAFGINLMFGIKGGLDRMFWIGRPFSKDEYTQLCERLEPYLTKHHPGMDLGF